MQEQATDCSALSVVVPVRIDIPDRLENLRASSAYLRAYFTDAELILVESDAQSHVPDELKARFDKVILLHSDQPFAKSMAMNAGLLQAERPVIAFYDVDVLVYPAAAAWALGHILSKRFPLVLPFNGTFVDVDGSRRRAVIDALSVGLLAHERVNAINARTDCTARIVDGGVFFADRYVMIAEGGYNVKMISYGWEDIEVLRRFEQLGYYRAYARHNLIHLNHARGPDSVRNEHTDRNRDEYERVRAMSRNELRAYAASDLAIAHGEATERLRAAVRLGQSRANLSLTHLVAFLSKVISRLRHRFA